jgi:hypothetical protein
MREIRAPNAVFVVSRTTAQTFLDLLQVEEERDIYATGMRVIEYPDGTTPEQVQALVEAAKKL